MELDLLLRLITAGAAIIALIGGLYKFGTKYGSAIKMRLTKSKSSARGRLKALLTGTHPKLEQEINRLKEVPARVQKMEKSLRQVAHRQQKFEQTIQPLRENVEHIWGLFQVKCPDVKCKSPILTRIPNSLIKGTHPVDGRPKGKLLGGREEQVMCDRCKGVFHIVY